MKADNLQTLVKGAGLDVEPVWFSIFAKALEGQNLKDILGGLSAPGAAPAGAAPAAGAAAAGAAAAEAKEEEKKEEEEESDEDMGFGKSFSIFMNSGYACLLTPQPFA